MGLFSKDSPSQPAPPDPLKTAQAQGAINKDAAIASAEMSMVNQDTPYGSLKFGQTGTSASGNPIYTATQTLSPEQQVLFDLSSSAGQKFGETANTQLDNVRGALESPLDFSALGAAPVANEATRTASRDAMLARLQPQFERDENALKTSLINQGFVAGSEGYNQGLDEFNRSRNDAYLAADARAGDEMARAFGLEANARDRAVNELTQSRAQPLNELAAMLSGAQVQNPSFINAPQTSVTPADLMGATYASGNLANQNYAQSMANDRATTQGLFGLAGTGIGGLAMNGWAFSDRRLKRDIEKIGTLDNGLNVYVFSYIGDDLLETHIGLMADEVKELHPEAVKSINGYDAVNYSEAVR